MSGFRLDERRQFIKSKTKKQIFSVSQRQLSFSDMWADHHSPNHLFDITPEEQSSQIVQLSPSLLFNSLNLSQGNGNTRTVNCLWIVWLYSIFEKCWILIKTLWEVTCSELIIALSQHHLLWRQSCIIHCTTWCSLFFCPPLIDRLSITWLTDKKLIQRQLFISLCSVHFGTAASSCPFITPTTVTSQSGGKVPTSNNQTRERALTGELQETSYLKMFKDRGQRH